MLTIQLFWSDVPVRVTEVLLLAFSLNQALLSANLELKVQVLNTQHFEVLTLHLDSADCRPLNFAKILALRQGVYNSALLKCCLSLCTRSATFSTLVFRKQIENSVPLFLYEQTSLPPWMPTVKKQCGVALPNSYQIRTWSCRSFHREKASTLLPPMALLWNEPTEVNRACFQFQDNWHLFFFCLFSCVVKTY